MINNLNDDENQVLTIENEL